MESLTITVDEAAKLLGIGRSLCYELARSGKLPALRLGRRVVISRKGLEHLLEQSTTMITEGAENT
jgi:excisionase family DNA binding protein